MLTLSTSLDAQILDYNGLTPLLPAGTDTDDISSFLLTDNRDTKTYKVRRLADGDCWMVQNLDLNLASFAFTNNLTNKNTDLTTITSWDPAKTMYDHAVSLSEEDGYSGPKKMKSSHGTVILHGS